MRGLTPYIHFPGTAHAALSFYADVFGGMVQLHTFSEFGRDGASPDAIAHGCLVDGPVALYGADVAHGGPALHTEGIMMSLLGTTDATTLHRWFERLSEGGLVVDDLRERAWGASDGQVIDNFGLHWLLGYEHAAAGDHRDT